MPDCLIWERDKMRSIEVIHQWSDQDLERLGPVIDVPTAASILDISEWTAYEMIRRGEWERNLTSVLRFGRRIKIPTAQLIDLLHGDGARDGVAAGHLPDRSSGDSTR